LDSKIQDVESKLKIIESKLSLIESEKNKVTQSIHKSEITQKNIEIKKLENVRKQEQLESQRQEQLLQEQIRQEQLESQRQEQLRKQQEYDAQRQEQQLQEEIQWKEKQKIMQEALTNPVIDGLIDGTIYFYIDSIPPYYKVPGIYDAIDEIASSLERTFYGIKIQRTYNESNADIHITWVKDFGSSKLGHATFKKYVEVELGENNCWGNWQAYDTRTIKKVLWHEIGHSLGYDHSNDPDNVMYDSTQSQFYGNEVHSFTLKANYNQWFNFCKSGNVGFIAKSSTNTDGFDAFAIPPDDPVDFSHNGGSVYLTNDGENCGKRDVISITRYCNVGLGALLHFKNKESHPIFMTVEYIDTTPSYWPDMAWPSNTFEYDTSYMNYVRDLFR
jgi:hypothetical protein